MNNIKLSAVVVTFNESAHLAECLESLKFADELIVIDLGSTDTSVEIAESCGARVIAHDWVPVIEMIREWAFEQATYNWIVHLDPDEVFPPASVQVIKKLILADDGLAYIGLPLRNYYMGKPVMHGRWGSILSPARIINRERTILNDVVHAGFGVRQGFHSHRFEPLSVDEIIKHYWIDSTKQFKEKHLRYLQHEGRAMKLRGYRFNIIKATMSSIAAFSSSLVRKYGILMGKTGIDLACKWSWYTWNRWKQLELYEEQNNKDNNILCVQDINPRRSWLSKLKCSKFVRFCKKASGYTWLKSRNIHKNYIYQCVQQINKQSEIHTAESVLISDMPLIETLKSFRNIRSIERNLWSNIRYIEYDRKESGKNILNSISLDDYAYVVIVSLIEYLGISVDPRSKDFKPDLDLEFMVNLRQKLTTKGKVFLILPVSCDHLFIGQQRVYGKLRLKKLFKGWNLNEQCFFSLDKSGNWLPVEESEVLKVKATRRYKNIGCFLLERTSTDQDNENS
ncbi:MAG: glycosyltransferase [Candidatus Aegiribacteria sp.]|nr:glycosyltransferase [Candidatus Aegiribacteria sp.]